MRRLPLLLLGLASLLAVVACTGASPHQQADSAQASTSSVPFTDWPTYHRTRNRAGIATSVINGQLTKAWTRKLAGGVYGEPLVVGSTLVVATQRNWVYGLDARTGTTRWSVHLGIPEPQSGLPCGNVFPLGITGTPAYDAATRTIFLVAETTGAHHTLWGINPATGGRRWHRNLDVLPNRNRHAEQQRSSLIVMHNRVLTTFGGLAGDCGNYVGYVTSVATDGSGTIYHYAVPTPREAGMWSPAGPVRGSNGQVYVAAGNGGKLTGTWDKSDSVTALGPIRLHRASVFAPGTWRADNRADLDLGSSSPAAVGTRFVIAGKRGTAYLIGQKLHGVGSAIATLAACRAFGGPAVSGSTVLMPCKSPDSVTALTVGSSTLKRSWSHTGIYGSPVIAGDRVYVADLDSGSLVVLALVNGKEIYRVDGLGSLTHFPSVAISGGMVFVPTLDGVTALTGS